MAIPCDERRGILIARRSRSNTEILLLPIHQLQECVNLDATCGASAFYDETDKYRKFRSATTSVEKIEKPCVRELTDTRKIRVPHPVCEQAQILAVLNLRFAGTPLAMALTGECLEMVEYLIERGAEINFPPHSSPTPLFAVYAMCAFEIGSNATEILRLLLRSGANVCFRMKDKDRPVEMTVLHCAAVDKNPSILLLLLGLETADVHFQLRELPTNVLMKDDDPTEDQSSIDRARTSSNKRTLSLNGSDSDSGRGTGSFSKDEVPEPGSEADDNPLVPDKDYSSGFNGNDRRSSSPESTDTSLSESYRKGGTPLHLAVKGRLVKNVKLLLEHVADPHIQKWRWSYSHGFRSRNGLH